MSPRSKSVRLAVLVLAVGAVLGITACSNGTSGSNSSTTTVMESSVSVVDAWARNSPMQVGNGAVFATITNPTSSEDHLVSVSVPSTIAKSAELHEVVTVGDMMKMQQVPSIAVPANGSLQLKSGAYHVMLMELVAPLAVGQTFEMTLVLEHGGPITAMVTVRDM